MSRDSAFPLATGASSWLNLTPNPYPSVYPSARIYPVMAYDPLSESTLLFGGATNALTLFNDTWSVASGNWTNLVPSSHCTSSTCPPGRLFPGFAYDVASQEAVLFGGLNFTTHGFSALSDTWTYSGGVWTNITSTAGTPPSPRYGMSMTYASAEGYVLLFGGATVGGAYLSDTWTFGLGKWNNISSVQLQTPGARTEASIADSPTGYTMLFGGINNAGFIQNAGGCPYIQWWFSGGQWTPAQTYTCIGLPGPTTNTSSAGQPCGRSGAAVAWSPKNQHFMLFGGEGIPGSGCPTVGSTTALNDTYLYLGAPGGGFSYWKQDSSPGGPSDRYGMGYAPDYRDGYVLVVGGSLANGQGTNDTWRYYAIVQASLKGPLVLQSSTTSVTFPLFTLTAFGGSGYLDYEFNVSRLKTPNYLSGAPDCGNFTDQATRSVPPVTGVVITRCAPDPGAYNVYRLSVSVWDSEKPTAHAYSNWTFTADPPESIAIHTKYNGTFYSGVSFSNTFSVYAQINNSPVTGMTASYGSTMGLTFSHQNSSDYWWSLTYDMGNAGSGDQLLVVASTLNWSENATLTLVVVETPTFLLTFIDYPGVVQTSNFTGSGPFNIGFTIVQSITISLSQLFNFSLPSSVPLINGIYNLLPSVVVSVSETSSGTVSLSGTLIFTPPAITFGAFSLTIAASLQMTGVMAIHPDNGVETIDWVSASVTIAIQGDFKGNFPIWGYSFDILGNTITIGFSLTVDLIPAVALSMVMVPANSTNDSIANGMNFMVTQLIGSLTLPLQVAINFGIGVASVSAGGTIAVAVNFAIDPPPFAWSNIWVNGTVMLQLQILFWSTQWNLTGPATIYHGMPSLPERPESADPATSYNNGSGAVWQVDPRAYNTTGYDQLLWAPSESSGVAISDIYPHAAPTAASDFGGANLFYTDDRVDQPVQRGLTFSGLTINSSSNVARSIPAPSDPGFVISSPQSVTLPDGSVEVVWDALPDAQAVGTSPSAVTTLALHGATYYPGNFSWGPVRQYTSSGGVAQSYAVDASGNAPIAVVLLTPGIIAGATTPESLVTYDLATGAVLSTASVSGYSEIVSVRGGTTASPGGDAILRLESGNVTEVGLTSGMPVPVGFTAPANATLVEERFVPGPAPVLLLRYRQPSGGLVVLYNTDSETLVASKALNEDVTDAEAIASGTTFDLYLSSGSGFTGDQVTADGGVTSLPTVAASGVSQFGLAQVGGSLLLYALVPAATGATGDRSLFVAEVASGLTPVAAGTPVAHPVLSPGPSSPTAFNAWLFLGIPLVCAAAVLVVVGILTRRPPRSPSALAGTAPAPPAPPPGAG